VNLFYQPLIDEGILYLDEDESRHCIKVLRKQSGDPIDLTDGKGYFYRAQIVRADPRQCAFTITEKSKQDRKPFGIQIAIAPTKNTDRMEWFVEKAVEVGVDKISLIECRNSERTYLKTGRLVKVAVAAMKQSLKAILPAIEDAIPVEQFIKSATADKFIAHVDAANPVLLKDAAQPGRQYVVLIGPEGDFTNDELATATSQGFTKVSLGSSRLRTETAGFAACHILNLINS
jgi:16S rRNA (uracil1498-N3)-methyltransferase